MFESILVVCTGNICRSPIGERLLRTHFPMKKIDSAGVGALIDYPADKSAVDIAKKYGLSLDNHKAQQFNSMLAKQYDLVLVMEKDHIEQVSKISPESRGKTMLLGHWDNQREIPDPYKKSMEAFDSVYLLLNDACQRWADKLNR